MPSVLHATLTGCACAGTVVVTMTYSTLLQAWVGSEVFGNCGRIVSLRLICPSIDPSAIAWKLKIDFDDLCYSDNLDPTAGSCAVFQVSYSTPIGVLGTCGCNVGDVLSIVVTI